MSIPRNCSTQTFPSFMFLAMLSNCLGNPFHFNIAVYNNIIFLIQCGIVWMFGCFIVDSFDRCFGILARMC